MTMLIAQCNILHWPDQQAPRQIDQEDPWFGGEVLEPGTHFSEPNVSEVARLVVLGAARLQ